MPKADLEVYRELKECPQIFQRINELSGDEFQIQGILRREFPPELVRAALTLVDLRNKGSVKFSQAASMWFDRQGYEQATAEEVANHKANRFKHTTLDLCCGIGADSMALAKKVPVIAVDLDPFKLQCCQWNTELIEQRNHVSLYLEDVTKVPLGQHLIHLDPDRRFTTSSKVIRIEQYVPGLEYMQELCRVGQGGAIKLSPAVNFGGKFPNAEVELISLSGECKEATIWFGELGTPGLWRATSLPTGVTLAGDPLSARAKISPVNKYLHDPDPAIVRSGLLDLLAEQLGIERTDAAEEYLTSEHMVESPFIRSFEVLENLPFNEKVIRQALHKAHVRELEIKCRHIPVNVDALRRSFKLSGDCKRVLIMCRENGDSRGLICQRIN
jgi:hypothetical protein